MGVGTVDTARLVLRPFTAEDLDDLAAVFAVEAVWQFPTGRGWSRHETAAFLDRTFERYERDGVGLWGVVPKAHDRLIGFIGLSVPYFLPEVLPAVEVGWRLHPDWWGQGLATEGGRASVRYGFEELGLERLVSIYDPRNVASGRVMDHLGFTLERITADSAGTELHVRELQRSDWEDLRCA